MKLDKHGKGVQANVQGLVARCLGASPADEVGPEIWLRVQGSGFGVQGLGLRGLGLGSFTLILALKIWPQTFVAMWGPGFMGVLSFYHAPTPPSHLQLNMLIEIDIGRSIEDSFEKPCAFSVKF